MQLWTMAMDLNTKTIRMMWTFVETSNPYNLLMLSDRELIQQLLEQIESVTFLSSEDNQILSKYIGSRTLLIRDLVYSKIG